MPRSTQTVEKSKDKSLYEKKDIKKKSGAKEQTNGKKDTLDAQERRIKRIKNLNAKIEEFSKKQHICAFAPSVRLVKNTVVSFGGEKVRMRPEALNLIISSTDDFINKLLVAAQDYIPKNNITLQPSHIYKALARPEFRSSISMVNSRMNLDGQENKKAKDKDNSKEPKNQNGKKKNKA